MPDEPKTSEEPAAADLAAALAQKLRRLEAIRAASENLSNRPRLGRDMFLRGEPRAYRSSAIRSFRASLYELLQSYAQQRQRAVLSRVTVRQRVSGPWRRRVKRSSGSRVFALEWTVLDDYIERYMTSPQLRRTVRASSFSASLELVREGKILLRQDGAFAPIWIKGRSENEAA